ncbi:hypothetical protein DSCW_29130 [Desulfosarcina widdelii]|uniref:Flagellar Assembly Protein A N-terminal region domain-containing protein n=1 Tax=Desulfosarcina widdelii TaxID=947919 RepID=A0A5K7Z1D3_9BACT|nr:FapA family protein [Desulfosarcina widdelii]BBO75496.1 hypothetical protein DSCW_29130 [Desulfosarcina widdelii]
MTDDQAANNRFGEIAVEMNFVEQEKIDKALVVQKRIFQKAGVSMPIGQILVEMGTITADVCKEILEMQREIENKLAAATGGNTPKKKPSGQVTAKGDNELDIRVSRDKLTVTATIEGKVPATEFDVNDVKVMLHSESILYGIVEDKQIEAFLKGESEVEEGLVIAKGTAPVPDTPPELKYHFDTDPLKVGTLTEDGLMDWKERGSLPQVKEGDLLAEKIPGPPGKEGMDVYGKKIPIPKARDKRFKCGKGARKSEDGMQVYATQTGFAKLSFNGEISVMPTLHIEGDISLETGHVTFDGHIEVTGTVEKGYRVKGGSLRANEIRDAQVDIDGDITATKGILGATIRCGGNLKAGHINNADIVLAGDIAVEKEVIESKIEANGRFLINDGIIIGSTISAKMGISAMDIGTEASKSSELIVGIDQQMEREAESIAAEIQSIKKERESLPKRLEKLKEQSDHVNTRLGEVAQEQDKCMVQHRQLQKEVDTDSLNQGDVAAEKLQQRILELQAKQEAYDEEVAGLMEQDDAISQEIEATEARIVESKERTEELNTRLDAIAEARKTDQGIAAVKIGGNVFSGTKLTGPHSVLVLQENLKRLSIVETDKPDHEGAKRWRFELAPFR